MEFPRGTNSVLKFLSFPFCHTNSFNSLHIICPFLCFDHFYVQFSEFPGHIFFALAKSTIISEIPSSISPSSSATHPHRHPSRADHSQQIRPTSSQSSLSSSDHSSPTRKGVTLSRSVGDIAKLRRTNQRKTKMRKMERRPDDLLYSYEYVQHTTNPEEDGGGKGDKMTNYENGGQVLEIRRG